jgi:hypothetical protein
LRILLDLEEQSRRPVEAEFFSYWQIGQVLLQLLVALSNAPLVGVIHLNFLP